jgi:hypothetical protein
MSNKINGVNTELLLLQDGRFKLRQWFGNSSAFSFSSLVILCVKRLTSYIDP